MFNRRLIALVSKAHVPLVVSVLFSVLGTLVQAFVLFQVAVVLEQIAEAASLPGEWVRPLGRAVAGLVAFAACSMCARFFAARAASSAKACISQSLFDKLVDLGGAYALSAHTTQVVQLFGEGAQALSAYVGRYVPQFLCAAIVPLVLALPTARYSIPSAVAMVVFVFAMPVAIMRFMKQAKDKAGDQWGSYTNLGAAFYDAIAGLATLKVYGSDAEAHWALNDQAEHFRTTTMRLLHVQLNSVTFMDLFTYCGIALGCAVALVQMKLGMIGTAETFFVVLVAPLFFVPMRTFGTLFHVGTNGASVADALFAVLDTPLVARGTQHCTQDFPEIAVRNLSFSYGGQANVLHDITLDIPANSIVGITGVSGSGKTTLARVLSGAGMPYGGSVKVGGVELAHMDAREIGNVVTVVSRQSHLFAGTVRSNMLLADPDASDAYIWTALHRARVADDVLAAGGLDAPVAEGGANFSGGQRQRLCFARAILRDTPIYIFDEAASNVDAESEKLIYNVMHEIAFTKTVIVISHRLHMLSWVDEVFVMEDGTVVEHGQPTALLAAGGAYRALWESYTALEDFAARISAEDEAVPEAAPTPVEEVLASLPGMARSAMQAVVDAKQMQRYLDSGSGQAAGGHPAWIPLPASYVGMAAKAGTNAKVAPDAALGEAAVPDATAVSDAAAPAATPPAADAVATPPAADAVATPNVEDAAPAMGTRRSFLAVARELAALTVPMRSDLKEALFAGFSSNLAAVALFGFAACALLAAVNLMSEPVFFVGLAGMLLCGLARGPLHYGERLYSHDQTFKTLALIRSKVFEAMRRLAPAKLAGRNAGDLVALVTSDVELLEGFYSRTLTPVMSALLCAAAVCVASLVVSPVLGVAVLACCALCGIGLPLALERTSQEKGADIRAFAVAMQSFLFDSLEGFSDLVQFGRAGEYANEMRGHFHTLETGEASEALRDACVGSLAACVALACQVLLALVGWFAVSQHVAGVAEALLVLGLGIAQVAALGDVGQWGAGFGQTHAAADRILDLLAEQPQASDVKGGVRPDTFSGARAENVRFGYVQGNPVLDGVSLDVPATTAVRVVGASGTGKTTLLALFMRFWDVESGCVRLSGADVRDISTSALRGLESYMTQDTYLFADTLRSNIKIAKRDATAEQVDAAVAAAALQDVVNRLPQGLDTRIGRGGALLSEGERQRVGLARAFLHDAPLMVLDEPTSNLDALNEAAIIYSLAQNTQGKTLLVASHRPTMAALADSTISLD